ILYVLLIIVFSFFYAFLMVNPNKIAENFSGPALIDKGKGF
ncbi:MAG: hypothetical protein EBV97_17440, partial [Rhodobacteraceae bacterium]|nr:hypothetical protein [Paracoccaceae bacterium]